jgi:hypothetical protein
LSTPVPEPTGKLRLTRGAAYAAIANVLFLLAFIFNGSCLGRTDQPPLAYPVSTPLSKPLRPRVYKNFFRKHIIAQKQFFCKMGDQGDIVKIPRFLCTNICFLNSFLLYYIYGKKDTLGEGMEQPHKERSKIYPEKG